MSDNGFRAVYAPHEKQWRWMNPDTNIIAGRGDTPALARADAERLRPDYAARIRATYANQFSDFVLDVEIPADWEDTSWGNNVCPSWLAAGGTLEVWIDYADPTLREFGPTTPRFHVNSCRDGIETSGPSMRSDVWSEVLSFVATHTVAK